MDTLRLAVIIVSTRPVRVGLPVGKWFFETARAHGIDMPMSAQGESRR